MPDLWMDVDAALSEVPVNILPLIDDTDFKTREVAIVYNSAGMDLVWNFVTTAGAMSTTAVTPTTAGDYDWAEQGTDEGMYSIEIPASGGASINNNTEGFGWFTGIATGVLPWRGPVIGFRAAGLNNALIDSAYSATRGLTGTALPAAAADAAGGIPISDAGGLDLDTKLANTNEVTVARMATLTDWINGGRLDLLLDAIKAVTDLLPDAGALTTIGTDTARLTAVRAAVLTDWINGGRLDLLLDAIPTTAMRGTDSAALASVCTEARLAELDAGNLPTDISNLNNLSSADVIAAIEDAGLILVDTTIATLASQTSFTLTAGSTDDDAYNGCVIVVEDVSTAVQKAVGVIKDYTGGSKTITLQADPGIFVMAATDKVRILPISAATLDWLDGERLDLLLDAIPTTAMRGTDSGALASVCTEGRLAELDAANLPADVGAIPTTAMRGTDSAALASVATEARLSELDAATGGKMANQVDLVKTEADKIALSDAGAGVSGSVIEEVENRATPAQVNTEVADVISTDAQAEPGQGAPAVNASLGAKINYLYKWARNKVTQTTTERKHYADDGSTVDQKATVSDDATTFTRGEIGTGA